MDDAGYGDEGLGQVTEIIGAGISVLGSIFGGGGDKTEIRHAERAAAEQAAVQRLQVQALMEEKAILSERTKQILIFGGVGVAGILLMWLLLKE